MKHWMFNCKEVTKKLSISMDTTLPFHHRLMLSAHFLMCKYCNRFSKQMLILRNAIRFEPLPEDEPGPSEALSETARKRIRSAVKEALS